MIFVERLLKALNIDDDQYSKLIEEIDLNDLENPYNFVDIEKAYNRLEKAIENSEKVMIYGDYDCDGIMATSILMIALKKRGLNPGYYIPSRYLDGYGITTEKVLEIANKGYSLIVTVDNGVNQIEALTLAKERGIDVIVTDHHEMMFKEVPSYAIVHPFKRKITSASSCGAYVSFMLSRLILQDVDHYLLALASLATVSDLMELKDHNRTLLRLGLRYLNSEHYLQFDLLSKSEHYDETTLGFEIAPKINAVGRVNETIAINRVVKYFVETDRTEIVRLHAFIENNNNLRKALTQNAVSTLNRDNFETVRVIINECDKIQEGLVGVIASRILNEYQKPCIILTSDSKNPEFLIGSARSYEGISLIDIFSATAPLLERYGGHACAGGLTLKRENLPSFIASVNEYIRDKTWSLPKKAIVTMEKDDFNDENFAILESLHPFGNGFEEPFFSINLSKNEIYPFKENHIRGKINSMTSFIGFSLLPKIKGEQFKLIGKWKKDRYGLNFKVDEVIIEK